MYLYIYIYIYILYIYIYIYRLYNLLKYSSLFYLEHVTQNCLHRIAENTETGHGGKA